MCVTHAYGQMYVFIYMRTYVYVYVCMYVYDPCDQKCAIKGKCMCVCICGYVGMYFCT